MVLCLLGPVPRDTTLISFGLLINGHPRASVFNLRNPPHAWFCLTALENCWPVLMPKKCKVNTCTITRMMIATVRCHCDGCMHFIYVIVFSCWNQHQVFLTMFIYSHYDNGLNQCSIWHVLAMILMTNLCVQIFV